MGTIGHHTLLYTLNNWQIRAAVRGYYRSQRALYDTSRFISLVIASCHRDPKKPPIKATDLATYPWDRKHTPAMPSDEEIQRLRELMREENERSDT